MSDEQEMREGFEKNWIAAKHEAASIAGTFDDAAYILWKSYLSTLPHVMEELRKALKMARAQIMELAEYHYNGDGGEDADGYSLLWQFVGNKIDPVLTKAKKDIDNGI